MRYARHYEFCVARQSLTTIRFYSLNNFVGDEKFVLRRGVVVRRADRTREPVI